MLSFDRTSVENKAARVDGKLASTDPVWLDGDARPVGDLVVTGRLSSAGDDRFYFSGRMTGTAQADCRRCLTPATATVDEELHLLFADGGDEETDDSDVYVLEPRATTVDLRPALREEWLLVVPALLLCREDCKGLCPRCGADLNQGACSCPPEVDPRWDALRRSGRAD